MMDSLQWMDLAFPADPSQLADIRRLVRRRAAGSSIDADRAWDLAAAVSEACSNVIEHTSSDEIALRFRGARGALEVSVSDSSGKRAPLARIRRHPYGGHGVQIMRALVDELIIDQNPTSHSGRTVRLIQHELPIAG